MCDERDVCMCILFFIFHLKSSEESKESPKRKDGVLHMYGLGTRERRDIAQKRETKKK